MEKLKLKMQALIGRFWVQTFQILIMYAGNQI